MPISKADLVTEFGAIIKSGNAALFLGAGVSMGAGYPSWDKVASGMRREARIPRSITNPTEVAEYYSASQGGISRVEAKLAEVLSAVVRQRSESLEALLRLPVSEIWTTNYDTLIEETLPAEGTVVISRDTDYRDKRLVPAERRVVKIHGDFSKSDEFGRYTWVTPPVITRSDFERYDLDHPVFARILRAMFLTKSCLFVGSGLHDPNIEMLLRLTRTMPNDVRGVPHYSIQKVPDHPDDRAVWKWNMADLERSGVRVCPVDDFAEITEIAEALLRRTMPPSLFVAGSPEHFDPDMYDSDAVEHWEGHDEEVERACLEDKPELWKDIGSRLARLGSDIVIQSLAGPAALAVVEGMKAVMVRGEYSPDRFVFHYRQREGEAAPMLPFRAGTCVFHDLDLPTMRRNVIRACRAMLVIGGGTRTPREAEIAMEAGIPVIPVASTGGYAEWLWRSEGPSILRWLDPADPAVETLWNRLLQQGSVGADAVAGLVNRCMYL